VKVQIIGGGPAGLYFAILLKSSDQRHQIEVFERNARDNTFGWGVVFSDKTMASLAEPDPIVHERMLAASRTWENVDIVHRGVLTSVRGNRFSGIARIALLEILQQRCRELGIPVHYSQEVESSQLGPADLVVGADGIASRFRARHRRLFGASLQEGRNRYIWYGTRQPFGGLTLTFRPHEGGLYMAHSYKYSQDLSTFIVEVDEATWGSLRYLSEANSRRRLEQVFAADLGGHPLLSNRSRWIRFVQVRNRNYWALLPNGSHGVLLGVALRTAHFSIGSGTKLAMEDSVALWRAFLEHPRPQEALPAFERSRRPSLEKYQELADTSQRWFENARTRLDLEVLPFAYEVMTRSSKVDEANLERRDPAFVAAFREWQVS
jgi:2-polyprenyl-6-methoxyphenol hydroxylase-like FAD-dependent oxidoreductase